MLNKQDASQGKKKTEVNLQYTVKYLYVTKTEDVFLATVSKFQYYIPSWSFSDSMIVYIIPRYSTNLCVCVCVCVCLCVCACVCVCVKLMISFLLPLMNFRLFESTPTNRKYIIWIDPEFDFPQHKFLYSSLWSSWDLRYMQRLYHILIIHKCGWIIIFR